jgi:hypothetical protein
VGPNGWGQILNLESHGDPDVPGEPQARDEPNAHAVAEEQRRADRLRLVVDVTCGLLRQARMEPPEAYALVALARDQALLLFPDKGAVFDLVIAPRFRRIIDERWPTSGPAD